MNKTIKRVLIYLGIMIFFSLLYLASFRLPLEKIITVYTYRGIFLLFVVSILLLITLVIFKKFIIKDMDIKDIVIVFLLFSLMHLYVFSMVPVTLERAYSVFMLNEINKAPNHVITIEQSEELFWNDYIKNNDALQKRFNEQVVTGTVKQIDSETYKLTDKGKLVVSLFHLFDEIYDVDSKLLK